MNVGKVLVAVCLCAMFALPAVAGVSVTTPTSGSTSGSPVHFVASAWSGCAKGVSAMGIYTAPGKLAYTVNGAKLDTYLSMGNGTYNVVAQEWDNCASSTTAPLTLTVGGSLVVGRAEKRFQTCKKERWLDGLRPAASGLRHLLQLHLRRVEGKLVLLELSGVGSPSMDGISTKSSYNGGSTQWAVIGSGITT